MTLGLGWLQGWRLCLYPFPIQGGGMLGGSCMSPLADTRGNTSASSWALPATPGPAALTLGAHGAAAGWASCWHHPNLAEVVKSCVETHH